MDTTAKKRGPGNRVLVLLVTPVIASLIIPVIILDIWAEIYHRICFPIYKIPYVPRGKYVMVTDRLKLPYLNPVQKIGCAYCGYVNGLMRYWKEIVNLTEKHWCPIKHAMNQQFAAAEHQEQMKFADYGDEAAFKDKYMKS